MRSQIVSAFLFLHLGLSLSPTKTFAQSKIRDSGSSLTGGPAAIVADTATQPVTGNAMNLVFDDAQVSRLLAVLKAKESDGPGAGTIALLGALIGAVSAILAQLIMFWLGNSKEKKQKHSEILAEERSLAYQVIEAYNELAWLKVSYEFWYRSHALTGIATEYQQFLLFSDKVAAGKKEISNLMSKYSKTVTIFARLNRRKENTIVLLNSIRLFPPIGEESSDFENITQTAALNIAAEAEKERLRTEYQKLSTILDQIYMEMSKS